MTLALKHICCRLTKLSVRQNLHLKSPIGRISLTLNFSVSCLQLHAPEEHLGHGAIAAQRGGSTKGRPRPLNSLESSRAALLQPIVAEELTGGVFCFGDAIGDHHEAVAGLQLVLDRLKLRKRNEPNRQVSIFQLDHLLA